VWDYTLVVGVGVGLLLGLLLGGRPRHLAGKGFQWWVLLPIGMVLQAAVALRSGSGFALLIGAYVLLIVFAFRNLGKIGMGTVLIGIALNLAVIGVNHGMPVRHKALVAAHIVSARESVTLSGGKHHLERPGQDRLMVLADIIPVRPLHQVVSFGDLVLWVGVVDLLVHLMRPGHRRPRRRTRPPHWPGEVSTVSFEAPATTLDLTADVPAEQARDGELVSTG
jgi:hypothetical protein